MNTTKTATKFNRFFTLPVDAAFHVFSRTIADLPPWSEEERERLQHLIRIYAYHFGLEYYTYCVLPNQFHILLKSPQNRAFREDELVRRYQVVYSDPSAMQVEMLRALYEELRAGGERKQNALQKIARRMLRVDLFLRCVKQVFSVRFNRRNNRRGTLWDERFKQVIIEGMPSFLRITSAYIDLIPVRKGLVENAVDYRFGSLHDWAAGMEDANSIFDSILPELPFEEQLEAYSQLLNGQSAPVDDDPEGPPPQQPLLELRLQPNLPVILRQTRRQFHSGLALGSESFILSLADPMRDFGISTRHHDRAYNIPGFEPTGLKSFRNLLNFDLESYSRGFSTPHQPPTSEEV